MKKINYEWLLNKIRLEESSPRAFSGTVYGSEMSPLGVLIWNARVHMGLNQIDFASKCKIDLDEVVNIEDNNAYIPDIRTVYLLAKFFQVSNHAIAELAGFVKIRDKPYQEQLFKFAAHSSKIGCDSDITGEIYEQFLAVLHERRLNNG